MKIQHWSNGMRVLIADHELKVRFALRTLLSRQTGLVVVGEADTPEDVLAQVSAAQPDLVLLHWRLCEATPDLLPALKRVCSGLCVIVLSVRPETRRDALAAGAEAFVCKMDPPDKLLAAIDQVESSRCQRDSRGHASRGLGRDPHAVQQLSSEGREEEASRPGPFLLGKENPELVLQ
jgi:DNA-binding NarL/FixJ family response regulator